MPTSKDQLARRGVPNGISKAYAESFKHAEASPQTGRRWYGKTKRLRKALRSGRLRLYVPGQRITVETSKTSVTEGSSDFVAVHGDILQARAIPGPVEPCLSKYGNFGLYDTPEGMSGFINTATASYTIAPVSPTHVVIFEAVVPPGGNDEDCGECDAGPVDRRELIALPSPSRRPAPDESLAGATVFPDPICVVDLAVVFDARANAEVFNPNAEAQALVARMNDVLTRSDIDDQLQYRLAGVRVLAQRYPNTDARLAFQQFNAPRPDGPSFEDQLRAARIDFAADQVKLMVAGPALNGTFGVSQLYDRPIDRWRTVTTVGSDWRFSGVHELAHNHGCMHEDDQTRGGDGELEGYARASNYIENEWSTILGDAANIGILPQRSPNFSNPDVTAEQGTTTGAADRDNARRLAESACFVAGMVDSETLADNVWVGGPNTVCAGDRATYTFSFRCNNSTAERVQWEASVDGGPFRLVSRGAASIRYRVPKPNGTRTVLRATARCSDGFVSGTKTIYSNQCIDPCAVRPRLTNENPTMASTPSVNVLYGDVQTSIQPSLASDEHILEVIFSDFVGRRVSPHAEIIGGTVNVDTGSLPAGTPVAVAIVTDRRTFTTVFVR